MSERLVIAVDGSPASEQALDYVANLTHGRTDLYYHLVTVLPPSAAPKEGENSELESAARQLIERFESRLAGAGVDPERLDGGTLVGHPDRSMVDGLLDVARDQEAGTIVVGRNALPWYREIFHHHVADELVKRAQGFAVWIVER